MTAKLDPTPAPLDVERLAWAYHRILMHGTDQPCHDDRAKVTDIDFTREVLAEYAALSAEGEPRE